MIMEKRINPQKYEQWLTNNELPESLNIPHLHHVSVYDDHVSIVMARNPDWIIGARIWSLDSTKKHADQPTKYPGIYYFQYTNDLPESPTNIK